MAPPLAASFVMQGARSALAGGLTHIEEQIKGIERAVNENPGLAFDLAKTVVESTCRTICVERNITFAPDDDLPRLYKTVITNLPMLPPAASGEAEARKSLVQTLNGLHTALQGVCELRNAYGFASHGAEGPRLRLESVQALLAAQAADAIVGFLHRIHRQERGSLKSARTDYADNDDFNSYVDEMNEQVMIFDLSYRPSEVLFSVDHEAYRDFLADFKPGDDDTHVEIEPAPTRGTA